MTTAKLYNLYDTENNKLILEHVTTFQIADNFGMHPNKVAYACRPNYLLMGRYKIEKVLDENGVHVAVYQATPSDTDSKRVKTSSFAYEWVKTCEKVRSGGKRIRKDISHRRTSSGVRLADE